MERERKGMGREELKKHTHAHTPSRFDMAAVRKVSLIVSAASGDPKGLKQLPLQTLPGRLWFSRTSGHTHLASYCSTLVVLFSFSVQKPIKEAEKHVQNKDKIHKISLFSFSAFTWKAAKKRKKQAPQRHQ